MIIVMGFDLEQWLCSESSYRVVKKRVFWDIALIWRKAIQSAKIGKRQPVIIYN